MIQKNDTQDKPLVNRVANSGLITFVLEDLVPDFDIETLDITQFLWKGLVLKEKEFRAALKAIDWKIYGSKVLCVHCSADAIVPTWAYMLVASMATPYVKSTFLGTREEYLKAWFAEAIDNLDIEEYRDARVVVKGCARENVPESAYVDLLSRLQPVVKSIMYGEPCSTVPLYKRR